MSFETAERPRVLAVDDDRAILAALRRLLRDEPYELDTVDNAKEAVELLRAQSYRLLITDERMPDLCGRLLVAVARGVAPDTLCVILTAYPEVVDELRKRNPGVAGVLRKPWDNAELIRTIRHLLAVTGKEVTYATDNVVLLECGGRKIEELLPTVRKTVEYARATQSRPILLLVNLDRMSGSAETFLDECANLAAEAHSLIAVSDPSGIAAQVLTKAKSAPNLTEAGPARILLGLKQL